MRWIQAVTSRGIVAVLVALGLLAALVEIFLFNLPHWASLTTSDEIVATADNVTLQGVSWNAERGLFEQTEPHGKIEMTGFDAAIRTVWIDPEFSDRHQRQAMRVHFDDQGFTDRNTGPFVLVDGVERNNYILPTSMGHITRVIVEFDSDNATMGVRQIVLNKTVPLGFDGLRFLLLFGGLALVYLIVSRRAWRVPFDPTSRVQRVVNGCLVGAMIVIIGATVVGSAPLGDSFGETVKAVFTAHDHQYTRLIDAFLHGQLSFLETPDQSLLDAARPYDLAYRWNNNINYQWDFSFFGGKYYCYFGIVPALVLFLPWQLLTGQPLSTQVSVFVFASLAAWFLYLLWREVVRRWFPKTPYLLYVLGAAGLFGTSQLQYLAARPELHETAVAAGAVGVFFGVWALLKATAGDDLNLKWLGAGALGLALAVGCRPNLVFASLLLPVIVWPHFVRLTGASDLGGRHAAPGSDVPLPWPSWRSWLNPAPRRALTAVAVPYVIVAAGLMLYNGLRFGSVIEFGATYQLTIADIGSYMHRGFLGTLATAGYGLAGYLGSTLSLNELFPFVRADEPTAMPGYNGYLYVTRTLGLLYVPLLWFLALGPAVGRLLKGRRPLRPLVTTMVGLGLFQAAFIAIVGGVVGRYSVDFYWLLALPALVIMLLARQRGVEAGLRPGKLTGICAGVLLVTLFITLQVGLTGETETLLNSNPALFYRLQNMLRFW